MSDPHQLPPNNTWDAPGFEADEVRRQLREAALERQRVRAELQREIELVQRQAESVMFGAPDVSRIPEARAQRLSRGQQYLDAINHLERAEQAERERRIERAAEVMRAENERALRASSDAVDSRTAREALLEWWHRRWQEMHPVGAPAVTSTFRAPIDPVTRVFVDGVQQPNVTPTSEASPGVVFLNNEDDWDGWDDDADEAEEAAAERALAALRETVAAKAVCQLSPRELMFAVMKEADAVAGADSAVDCLQFLDIAERMILQWLGVVEQQALPAGRALDLENA